MKKIFTSPQTGSDYVLVTMDDAMFLAVRYVGVDPIFKMKHYRISLRGDKENLAGLNLSDKWSPEVIDSDHRSAVIWQELLGETIDEGIEAVKGVLGSVSMNDEWKEDLGGLELKPLTVDCPLCGSKIEMAVPANAGEIQ
jgi:hypothetical protein